MGIPRELAFRGVTLVGCTSFAFRRNVTEDKITVGAQGDVVRTKNTDRTGVVTMTFDLKSEGQKQMKKINAIELGATGQLEADAATDGFGTPAWIDPDRSDPDRGLWILQATHLPDE